mgnify:CR=1 FL=1
MPVTKSIAKVSPGMSLLRPENTSINRVETFAMDFVPGKGTQFYIQGQPQGAPVGDDEFFTLVLRIWFGDTPADIPLRDALLDGLTG